MSLRLRWSILAASFLAGACSHLPYLGVYKLEINQGNYVTQDMVDKLGTGMTKTQTKLVLGTPLVADPFHSNRWDYIYELYREGRLVEHHKLRVFFDKDKLAKWEGDSAPAAPPEVTQSIKVGEPSSARKDDQPGFFARLWERFGL